MTGARLITTVLEALGIEVIFGLAGTQNLPLLEALRRSKIRFVSGTNELSLGFMANGYYRASGRLPVLTTIPGPGFSFALTPLAEAREDSAALLYLVPRPASSPYHFALQSLPQREIARSLTKAIYEIESLEEIEPVLLKGYASALQSEPGPVMIEIAPSVFTAHAKRSPQSSRFATALTTAPDRAVVGEVRARLLASRRTLLYVGQGASGAAPELLDLISRLHCPVLSTCSGRGVLPEDHSLALGYDMSFGVGPALAELINEADLVLALGCKFTHNGTGGFSLPFAKERLVRVDASAELLGLNYQASLEVHADVGEFLRALIGDGLPLAGSAPGWSEAELAEHRRKLTAELREVLRLPPSLVGTSPDSVTGFFSVLRQVLPRDAILVTDAGLHQSLARLHFSAFAPRSIICPTDFQSMGFGIPAAIGAKLAVPERAVVAVTGDGGFQISAPELLSAEREGVSITTIVFHDGQLGSIRREQLRHYGQEFAVRLNTPDYRLLCQAYGIKYFAAEGQLEHVLAPALAAPGVKLVEVRLSDNPGLRMVQAKSYVRERARKALGRRVTSWLKERLRGERGGDN